MSDRPLPVVDYLKIPEEGEPYLEGSRCNKCDAVFLGYRDFCAKCGGRRTLRIIRLANSGKLYSFSVVHRSFPGVDVPYVSAIVDLDGGGVVKGNLVDVDPNPDAIQFDMRVEVICGDALGRKDSEGNSYLSYFFRPVSQPK